ncbi:uncharacterized protein FYW47_005266 [Aplochiton taeniatus]
MKIKKAEAVDAGAVSIDSVQAHGFLAQTRPKRNVDPKWYRGTPDFQSYYRYYNSIGHIEGLYEIDKIRILYQQMRHLEQVYGPDASNYQNILGVQTTTALPSTVAPTTKPPPPPTTPAPTPDPLADAQKIYLCNPNDLLCKPAIVYLPTGAVPVLCDPRYNPACKPKREAEIKAAAKEPTAAAAPPPPPPPSKEPELPPPPPAITVKGMEYDCDPYWDPDCLIDHPPRPIQSVAVPPPSPGAELVATEDDEKISSPDFDPYDYRRDLFDPYRYANPAPDTQ